MQFTILREAPANSGSFVSTGQTIDTTADGIISQVLDMTVANSARFAVMPYDPVTRPSSSDRLSGPAVVYAGPDSASIVTANVAVQVFAPGSVPNGADIVNTGTGVLYIDMTGPLAVVGSSTAIPLQPGQAFHFPRPPLAGVSAVASLPQSFVAVRY